jgi:hypothetical protein
VRHNQVLFAKMLLQQGADPEAQNNVRSARGAAQRTQAHTPRTTRGTHRPRRAQNEATAMSLAQTDEMRAVLKRAGQRPPRKFSLRQAGKRSLQAPSC